MNRRPVSSVRELHSTTGLPKPTLIRILETLVLSGIVAKDENQGGYRLTSEISGLSAGFHGGPRVVEVAAPICRELTRQIHWPAAIATLDVDAMVVRYSTIPEAPFAHVQSTLNNRLSLTARAHGRAYLAFCKQDERDILIGMIDRDGDAETARQVDRRIVGHVLAETRRKGYAMRDTALDPRTGTVAVPILHDERIVATIGITYFTRALTTRQIASELVPKLIDSREEISRRLA